MSALDPEYVVSLPHLTTLFARMYPGLHHRGWTIAASGEGYVMMVNTHGQEVCIGHSLNFGFGHRWPVHAWGTKIVEGMQKLMKYETKLLDALGGDFGSS